MQRYNMPLTTTSAYILLRGFMDAGQEDRARALASQIEVGEGERCSPNLRHFLL